MAEFREVIKADPKLQNQISQTIDKYNNESFSTRSQKGHNAFIQSNFFKQAITIVVETISDMYIELEQKYNKIEF